MFSQQEPEHAPAVSKAMSDGVKVLGPYAMKKLLGLRPTLEEMTDAIRATHTVLKAATEAKEQLTIQETLVMLNALLDQAEDNGYAVEFIQDDQQYRVWEKALESQN